MEILCVGVIAIMLTIGTVQAIKSERKWFNNGTCPHCHTALTKFDVDSQGGREYMCDRCGYTVWVSYKCVDRQFITNKNKQK